MGNVLQFASILHLNATVVSFASQYCGEVVRGKDVSDVLLFSQFIHRLIVMGFSCCLCFDQT